MGNKAATSKEITLADPINPSTTLNKSNDKLSQKSQKVTFEKGFKIKRKFAPKKLPEKLND